MGYKEIGHSLLARDFEHDDLALDEREVKGSLFNLFKVSFDLSRDLMGT